MRRGMLPWVIVAALIVADGLVVLGHREVVRRLFAWCEEACALRDLALAVKTQEDVRKVLKVVGPERERPVGSVVEVRRYLLREAARLGCEDRSWAHYLLGGLALREGRLREAAEEFKASAEAYPTVQSLEGLAQVYELMGCEQEAWRARVRARLTANLLWYQ